MLPFLNISQVKNGQFLRKCHQFYRFHRNSSSWKAGDEAFSVASNQLKRVMRKVPQPVVVVTTALYDRTTDTWLKRGVTCSSFTNISMRPPIVSFAVNRPSRMHNMMLDTEKFAVHVLARNQVGYGLFFAKPAAEGQDQFEHIPHDQDEEGVPIISDVSAVLTCKFHSVNTIGDHHVWYGEVREAYHNEVAHEPMLYYMRTFRSVGDEAFLQAFEDQTLPFEEWTHETHLRMAWNYIKEHGKEKATPLIRNGIQRYNEVNKDKISRGYNETVTMCYVHVIADAINRCDSDDLTFEEFIQQNQYIIAKDLLFKYYSPEVIQSKDSVSTFMRPDRAALPGT